MGYEQVWVVISVLAVCVLGGLGVLARHLQEKKRLAARELIHRERMAALEKGASLPAEAEPVDGGEVNDRWVERAALAAGLALFFGGIGMMGAFYAVAPTPDLEDLRALASLGIIPAFVGVGLLIFYWMELRAGRRLER